MPFPHHDRAWVETAQFLQRHVGPDDLLIAPDDFINELPGVHSHAVTFAPASMDYPWTVVHKGMLEEFDAAYLRAIDAQRAAVFANDVFVVFAKDIRLERVDSKSPHLKSFREQLARLEIKPAPARKAVVRFRPRPDIATLTVEEIRQEMNLRYSSTEHDAFGGYEHPHLWDQVRYAEVDRIFARMVAPTDGLTILQVGCGLGRAVPMLAGCRQYLGTDLSDVAIERARKIHGESDCMRFERMDAMNLTLPDKAFDMVVALEVIEHVTHADRAIREAFRVLRPGGKYLVNSVNRDSLHLRMLRKLGLPEFRATVEHVREFAFDELAAMLEQVGFAVHDSAGVFLLPYYGIPEVDRPMRPLTDDDPEVVEIFRELGERAGAAYGYEFVISAIKQA